MCRRVAVLPLLASLSFACGDDTEATTTATATASDGATTTTMTTTTGSPTSSGATTTATSGGSASDSASSTGAGESSTTTTTATTAATSSTSSGGSSGDASTTGADTTGEPTTGEVTVCGDGIVEGDELCDDGNAIDGDGCDANCEGTPGLELWTVVWDAGFAGQEQGFGAAIDDVGDIYVSGWAQEQMNKPGLIWLGKYDPAGEALWHSFVGNPMNTAIGYDVVLDGAMEPVVAGSWWTPDVDVALSWITDAGGLKETAFLDVVNSAAQDDPYALDRAMTGELAVAGRRGGNPWDPWIVVTDSSGEVLWSWLGGDDEGLTTVEGIAFTADGGVVAAGRRVNPACLWFARFAADGALTWSHDLAPVRGEYGDVVVDGDGSIYVAGHVPVAGEGGNAWIGKFDGDGEPLWATTYNSPGGVTNDRANALVTLPQGGVAVGGEAGKPGQSPDLLVLRIDGDGAILWVDTWDNGANTFDSARGLAAGEDGSIVAVGTARATNDWYDVVIRKFAG